MPGFDLETKRDDPRHDWFKRNYGDRCWELDAINPNALRERVRKEIEFRLDRDAWGHCRIAEKAERESLNSYIKVWPRS
jgi:hypothetical protein